MGKTGGDFMSPKAIANRMKAKGLQKLRWYCQMCQKQCRDENGFKCHLTSEAHQRQMRLFSEDPDSFMDTFSKEFEKGMLEIMSRRARTRINANLVYQEYIAFKEHIHMNATIWDTLTDFVIWLGRQGKAEVEQTEKGWFVTYVDRDPARIAAEEGRRRREAAERDATERHTRDLLRVAKRARAAEAEAEPEAGAGAGPSELRRDEGTGPLTLRLGMGPGGGSTTGSGVGGKRQAVPMAPLATAGVFAVEDDAEDGTVGAVRPGAGQAAPRGPPSAAAAIAVAEQRRKARIDSAAKSAAASTEPPSGAALLAPTNSAVSGAADGSTGGPWLCEGIVVKVMARKVGGGAYYRQKGVVDRLDGPCAARVRMLHSGDVLLVGDQDLETVIPQAGARVRVLRGMHRGAVARLIAIDEGRFCVAVELEDGSRRGERVDGIEYEDVSKVASQ